MGLVRPKSTFSTPSDPSTPDPTRPSFEIVKQSRSFEKQYANLYWLRLAVLRAKVAKRAKALWEEMEGVTSPPQHVKRVLDVENGNLCYIIGTVYMDMTLKPNVLEDLARENFIAAPAPRRKFCSDSDEVMLEDESGRVRLVGDRMTQSGGVFVTGTIMAALGAETSTGDFEVIEVCYAGLPPQDALKKTSEEGEWVAILSGLEMGGGAVADDLRATMFAEWLLGELGGEEDAQEAVKITRVIIAGDALAQPAIDFDANKTKRYGYDSSIYSSKPTEALDNFLAEILPSIPVDLMPGESDPVGPTMPQQPLHTAMLPKANGFVGFHARTNPYWCDVGGASFFGTSGQTLDDIFKYLTSEDRLAIAHSTLEWSHIAPTCPDTLWCYPFSDRDPFILLKCPHIYFIGNQPKFETKIVDGHDGQRVRVVLVPKFSETGEVVLVNTASLECRTISFGIE